MVSHLQPEEIEKLGKIFAGLGYFLLTFFIVASFQAETEAELFLTLLKAVMSLFLAFTGVLFFLLASFVRLKNRVLLLEETVETCGREAN